MRVLPRVVMPALVLALAAGVAGCSKFDAALGQQQAIVTFKPNVSNAMRLKVRATCAKLPDVVNTPIPSGIPLSYALSELTYQINNASDADIARLSECLENFPAVAGVTLQDSSDDGS
jgi:hypothetical protein